MSTDHKDKDEPKRKSSAEEKQEKQEKHTSFMGRFTRKSLTKAEEKEKEREDSITGQPQLFGVNIDEVASKGVPLMASYGVPAFIEESLEFIKQFRTASLPFSHAL